jgi:small-conductance mechanosensitive channel
MAGTVGGFKMPTMNAKVSWDTIFNVIKVIMLVLAGYLVLRIVLTNFSFDLSSGAIGAIAGYLVGQNLLSRSLEQH